MKKGEEEAKEALEPVEQPEVKTEKEAIDDLADIDKVVDELVKDLGDDFDSE